MEALLRKSSFSPSDILRPFIDRYWTAEGVSDLYATPKFGVGTGVEMIFQLGSPMVLTAENGETLQPPMHAIYCVRNQPYYTAINRQNAFISIRFRAGAIRHFIPTPVAAITETFPDIEAICGDEARSLNGQFLQCNGIREKLLLIEQFLIKLLQTWHRPQPLVDAAIFQLYYSQEPVNIAALSRQLGSSYRQFERLFLNHTGVSPKSFQQTARFHNAMKHLLFHSITNYLPVALDYGYYDQAHFIRASQRFLGERPRVIFGLGKADQHFYMPSLKR